MFAIMKFLIMIVIMTMPHLDESLRLEQLRLWPGLGIMVQAEDRDEQGGARGHRVACTYNMSAS